MTQCKVCPIAKIIQIPHSLYCLCYDALMPKAPTKRKTSATAGTVAGVRAEQGSASTFAVEYAKLNPEQRLAVETNRINGCFQ